MDDATAIAGIADAIEADELRVSLRNVEQGHRLEVEHPEERSPELSEAFATLKGTYGETLEAIAEPDLSAVADVDEDVRPDFREVPVEVAKVHPDALRSRYESAGNST